MVRRILRGLCSTRPFAERVRTPPASVSAMNIMYNNALKSDFGLYNGISASTTSAARCLFPLVAGSTFALGVSSADSAPFPLGIYLPFNLAGGFAVLAVAISFWLPPGVGLRQRRCDDNSTDKAEGGRVAADCVRTSTSTVENRPPPTAISGMGVRPTREGDTALAAAAHEQGIELEVESDQKACVFSNTALPGI